MNNILLEKVNGEEWLCHSNLQRNRVKKIEGIAAFYPWEGDEKHCYIDAYIVDIISILNKIGYVTWVSCSGIKEDHANGAESSQPYIGFRKVDEKLRDILIVCGFCNLWGDNTYYMINQFFDIEIKKNWDLLKEKLLCINS